MGSLKRKIERNNKKKNVSLQEVNKQLMIESNKIEQKMKQLQEEYGFTLDYAFKPITKEELENFHN